MEKKNHAQLELFSRHHTAPQKHRLEGKRWTFSFLGYVAAHEKALMMIIAFVIVGVASYSLGVERTRRAVKQPTSTRVVASKPVIRKAVAPVVKPVQPPKVESVKADDGKFTIQAASFKSSAKAKQEAESLKKKGFSESFTGTAKGGFFVVYVGRFPDEEKAKSFLQELKRSYRQDCVIRRI
ncbi:SPOR domain-containing protein [Candidatus Omnitrophota bacterium]